MQRVHAGALLPAKVAVWAACHAGRFAALCRTASRPTQPSQGARPIRRPKRTATCPQMRAEIPNHGQQYCRTAQCSNPTQGGLRPMQTGAVPMCVVSIYAHTGQPSRASFFRLADSAARISAHPSVCTTAFHSYPSLSQYRHVAFPSVILNAKSSRVYSPSCITCARFAVRGLLPLAERSSRCERPRAMQPVPTQHASMPCSTDMSPVSRTHSA